VSCEPSSLSRLGSNNLSLFPRVPAICFISEKYANFLNWDRLPSWIRLPAWTQQVDIEAILPQWARPSPPQRRIRRLPPPPPRPSPYDSTRRTTFSDLDVRIYAWPSKGGVIILDHAEAVDLEFLGLDPLNPPAKRLPNQSDEDAFCQRLLLLGAKWWDNEARFQLLASAMDPSGMDCGAIQDFEDETEPAPSMRERRWVSVAWPRTGGLWVAEFDTTLYGIEEEDNLVPFETSRLKLAHTMEERSEVLRDHFKATFYEDVRHYKGYAFLNSWEEKKTGEVGELMPCVRTDEP
jgi:hypothetical protein